MRFMAMARILAGILPAILGAAFATPAVADMRGDAVLYRDVGFRGGSIRIDRDIPDLRKLGVNDAASSISIRGGAWQLCEDVNFRGRCVVVGGDVSDFRKIGLNDKVSSLRRVDDHRGGSGGYGDYGRPGRGGLVVFRDVGMGGGSMTIDGDVPDLRRFGINDQISSLVVGSGVWVVCEDVNYRGRCLTVEHDIRDFGRFGFNDRISSLRRIR